MRPARRNLYMDHDSFLLGGFRGSYLRRSRARYSRPGRNRGSLIFLSRLSLVPDHAKDERLRRQERRIFCDFRSTQTCSDHGYQRRTLTFNRQVSSNLTLDNARIKLMASAGEGLVRRATNEVWGLVRGNWEFGIRTWIKKGNDSYDDRYRSNGYGYPVGS